VLSLKFQRNPTQYSKTGKYKGYGSWWKYDGDFVDESPKDKNRNFITPIVAIDAIQYSMKNREYNLEQFKEQHMLRDINKALAGFQPVKEDLVPKEYVIATGNWGCGVFGGMVELKSLEQWLAASQHGREVQYHTFGDNCDKDLKRLVKELRLKQMTVGNLWVMLTNYSEYLQTHSGIRESLFQFITSQIQNSQNSPPSDQPIQSHSTPLQTNQTKQSDSNRPKQERKVNNTKMQINDNSSNRSRPLLHNNDETFFQSCCVLL